MITTLTDLEKLTAAQHWEKTVIKENMVLTIEPAMEYAPGKMIVHEENIIIQQDGAELITKRAPKEIPVIK